MATAPTLVQAHRPPGAGTWCSLTGAVIVVLGVVMPWMRTTIAAREQVVTGVQGAGPWRAEGWALIGASVVAALACGPALLGIHRARANAVQVVAALVMGAFAALAWAGTNHRIGRLSQVGRAAGMGTVAERGPGLVVVGIGALAVAIGGVAGLTGTVASAGAHRRSS